MVQRQVTTGPGAFRFPDPSAGLAALSGYRAALSVTFDGTREGKPERTSKSYSLLAARNPSARLLTIDLSENDAKAATELMAESDGAAFERHGTSACVATVNAGAAPAGDRLEPASFLTGVLGASEATGGTVNTIESKHYTFDERAIGLAGVTHSSGELWIAVNGGYLVKYLLTSAGKADYFGAGMEGTLSLDYELTGANQPPSIQLPSECPAGMLDAPLLPDATSVAKLPGTTTFETRADLAAVAAFYQQQLQALGWRAQGNPSVAGTAGSLEYLRGQTHLLVNMYRTGDVTSVNIVADRTRR